MEGVGLLLGFLHSHLWLKPPVPTQSFAGQTVVVTGSNRGIGLEAARHFVRLGAARVVLAVRDVAKGEAAARDIKPSSATPPGGRQDATAVLVWQLDLESAASVAAFAARAAAELDRLDVVVANAGVYAFGFELGADGLERSVAVNVVHPFLLALLLLPQLRATAARHGTPAVLTFTGSFVHRLTAFPERASAPRIFAHLADPDPRRARLHDRYRVTKLMQLLCARELAASLTAAGRPGRVVVSTVNPGFVDTGLMSDAPARMLAVVAALKKLAARTPEEGARALVHAAAGGMETHGQYLSECAVSEPSPFVSSEEGAKIGRQLWAELGGMLEERHPGVMSNI